MSLTDLGFNKELEKLREMEGFQHLEIGRVVSEHKERYIVGNGETLCDGEILGNLRYKAQSRSDFPAVGDWVAISSYDEDKVLIHAIYPRSSIIERQAIGGDRDKQIIASNIDFAFIVQAVDRDFSINRIERYLSICYAGKVKPIIVLNKIDLLEKTQLSTLVSNLKGRIDDVPLFCISNESKEGIEELRKSIGKGKSYCLLGSSGVGKSTLINSLAGEEMMRTEEISDHSNRGRHITTHRELVLLPNGGIIIDNPGMREVGVVDSSAGIDQTFENIHKLAKDCKFKDCSHTSEIQCAVLASLEEGLIDEDSYQNYLKLEKEKQHFESSLADRKQKDKNLGKIIKNYKKNKIVR